MSDSEDTKTPPRKSPVCLICHKGVHGKKQKCVPCSSDGICDRPDKHSPTKKNLDVIRTYAKENNNFDLKQTKFGFSDLTEKHFEAATGFTEKQKPFSDDEEVGLQRIEIQKLFNIHCRPILNLYFGTTDYEDSDDDDELDERAYEDLVGVVLRVAVNLVNEHYLLEEGKLSVLRETTIFSKLTIGTVQTVCSGPVEFVVEHYANGLSHFVLIVEVKKPSTFLAAKSRFQLWAQMFASLQHNFGTAAEIARYNHGYDDITTSEDDDEGRKDSLIVSTAEDDPIGVDLPMRGILTSFWKSATAIITKESGYRRHGSAPKPPPMESLPAESKPENRGFSLFEAILISLIRASKPLKEFFSDPTEQQLKDALKRLVNTANVSFATAGSGGSEAKSKPSSGGMSKG